MFATRKTICLSLIIASLCVALVRSNPVSVKIGTENNDTSAIPEYSYTVEERAKTINLLATMFTNLKHMLGTFSSNQQANDMVKYLKNYNPKEHSIWTSPTTIPETIEAKRITRQVNPETYNLGRWSPTASSSTTGRTILLTHINGQVYEIGKWSSSDFSP